MMPITSPFRLKFLKFFQIRYLESQNLLTMPGRAYKAIRAKAVGPLFKLLESNSRNGVKLGKHAYGSYLLNENPAAEGGGKVATPEGVDHGEQLLCEA